MKNEKQKNTNEKRLSRKTIISLVAVVLVFAAVSVAMIPLIRLLSSEHGQEIIIEKMQSFGIFAPLLFVLLQVLQVVVAVIPGGPVPIIGGILFGQWGRLFLSLAGFFLGTVLVYYLVQWIGRPLVDRFVPESHFKKFDFLLEGKRTELLIFLVFLLPGLPKDALTLSVYFDYAGQNTCYRADCFYGEKPLGRKFHPCNCACGNYCCSCGCRDLYQAKSGQACRTQA